jgi:hypothetical protein
MTATSALSKQHQPLLGEIVFFLAIFCRAELSKMDGDAIGIGEFSSL